MSPSNSLALVFLLSFLTAPASLLQAQEPATRSSPPLPFNPQDGETVVFLGDSITHQCLYTQYVENFFFTRYPQRNIRFHNAGVGGDKAADALARFEEDVAAYQPDYVTVLLGMNDGAYENFNAELFDHYQTGVTKLLDRIEACGAQAIVLSPTMFDHAIPQWRKDDPAWRFRTKEFSPLYNALMAFYGGWALEECGRRRLPFVSLWAPLNTLTTEQRRTHPRFTLANDAIHPQASGQMVMAYEILSQLGVESRSAGGVHVIRRGSRWVAGKDVSQFEINEDASLLSFTHQPSSLPWVIPREDSLNDLKWNQPADGRLGYALTKAGHRLSADRLKISGLPPGDYEVRINGMLVGTWNQVALGTKVELQENERAPQFQQALQVAHLNRQRNDEAMRPLRDTWGRIKGLRRKFGNDPDQFAAAYAHLKPKIEELNRQILRFDQEIYAAAQPQPRHYEIRRLSGDR